MLVVVIWLELCMSYEFLLAPSFATRRFAIMALVYPKCPENWPLKTRVTQYKRELFYLVRAGEIIKTMIVWRTSGVLPWWSTQRASTSCSSTMLCLFSLQQPHNWTEPHNHIHNHLQTKVHYTLPQLWLRQLPGPSTIPLVLPLPLQFCFTSQVRLSPWRSPKDEPLEIASVRFLQVEIKRKCNPHQGDLLIWTDIHSSWIMT